MRAYEIELGGTAKRHTSATPLFDASSLSYQTPRENARGKIGILTLQESKIIIWSSDLEGSGAPTETRNDE